MTQALDTKRPSFTTDAMIEGRLLFVQPEKGYRFNLDSVILARSVVAPAENCLDLGSGCGIVGQIVLLYEMAERVTAVDLSAEMVECSLKSAELNHFGANKYSAIVADVRELPLEERSFDLILSNPPFFFQKGPSSPNEQRRLARHGAGETPADWFKAISRMLSTRGRAYMIFPAEALTKLCKAAREAGLKVRKMRFVHSFANEEAGRVILQLLRGDGRDTLTVEPPLVIFKKPGEYTPDVLKMLGRG